MVWHPIHSRKLYIKFQEATHQHDPKPKNNRWMEGRDRSGQAGGSHHDRWIVRKTLGLSLKDALSKVGKKYRMRLKQARQVWNKRM